MIIKTEKEILKMREAGLVLWEVHQVAGKLIKEGTTTKEIDEAVESSIISLGAIPLFKGVPGEVPFPACACISINDEVVHGIPSGRKLRSGALMCCQKSGKIFVRLCEILASTRVNISAPPHDMRHCIHP